MRVDWLAAAIAFLAFTGCLGGPGASSFTVAAPPGGQLVYYAFNSTKPGQNDSMHAIRIHPTRDVVWPDWSVRPAIAADMWGKKSGETPDDMRIRIERGARPHTIMIDPETGLAGLQINGCYQPVPGGCDANLLAYKGLMPGLGWGAYPWLWGKTLHAGERISAHLEYEWDRGPHGGVNRSLEARVLEIKHAGGKLQARVELRPVPEPNDEPALEELPVRVTFEEGQPWPVLIEPLNPKGGLGYRVSIVQLEPYDPEPWTSGPDRSVQAQAMPPQAWTGPLPPGTASFSIGGRLNVSHYWQIATANATVAAWRAAHPEHRVAVVSIDNDLTRNQIGGTSIYTEQAKLVLQSADSASLQVQLEHETIITPMGAYLTNATKVVNASDPQIPWVYDYVREPHVVDGRQIEATVCLRLDICQPKYTTWYWGYTPFKGGSGDVLNPYMFVDYHSDSVGPAYSHAGFSLETGHLYAAILPPHVMEAFTGPH
jgi:hypothetical protein